MTFWKISKTQKLPQTHTETKNSKDAKSHVRRPQVKKVQKTKYS